MSRQKAGVEEACPTCGQHPRKQARPGSDFDRAMDVWAARDAYRVQTALGLLAIPLLVGVIIGGLQGVAWVVWKVGQWRGY
jgi:hypothetical protein